MSNYDPSELLAVCESIVEDGELTYDELYRLAEWLNDHQEDCLHWPGNQLVMPLQEIWADGKVTKTEARKLARLILQLRKEWVLRQTEQAFSQAKVLAAITARTFDLSRAQPPAIPFSLRIKSHTKKGSFYDVDLSGPTCTCPDFRSFRSSLPTGHLSRCCKHVFDAFAQIEPAGNWPGWLRPFFEHATPAHPRQEWLVLHVGPALVLVSSAPKGWANVFASDQGPYDRYGYNIFEDRWAYGIAPPDDERIAKAVCIFAKGKR